MYVCVRLSLFSFVVSAISKSRAVSLVLAPGKPQSCTCDTHATLLVFPFQRSLMGRTSRFQETSESDFGALSEERLVAFVK